MNTYLLFKSIHLIAVISWIQNADFPLYTKKVLKEIKENLYPKKRESTLEDLQNKFNQKL